VTQTQPQTAMTFYVAGGTLQRDAPCYVIRQADTDLYEGLLAGEFCYVLDSRQMGKSSLMVHAAARLREAGIAVAVIDLTAIGQNLTPEQWYDGILAQIGRQLQMEDELEDFWLDHAWVAPLQRFLQTLRDVILVQAPGKVVLFVDEVDAVRSLPFSADEFFAGIRECYNRRAEDPEMSRLTFGLFGVASPTDLITNIHTTPFNIGKRIELRDFTEQSALPLIQGLAAPVREGRSVLARILYWTGGHPYLTQRLFQALAAHTQIPHAADVDHACKELFLSPRARERDSNLLFVQDRLLRQEEDRAGLLDLYQKIRLRRRIKDDEYNPLVTTLRLSGIVQTVGGCLQVRNRIYEHVFDLEWVRIHMPDAEIRRQQAAYQQGKIRATRIGLAFMALIFCLGYAVYNWRLEKATNDARAELDKLKDTMASGYLKSLQEARQALDQNNSVAARQDLLQVRVQHPTQDVKCGFEWWYLWRLCQRKDKQEVEVIPAHAGRITCLAFSPDGKWLATGGQDKRVILRDVAPAAGNATRKTFRQYRQSDAVTAVIFSPNGRLLATGCSDGVVQLWDVAVGKPIQTWRSPGSVTCLAFLSGLRTLTLAVGRRDRGLQIWNPGTNRVSILQATGNVTCLNYVDYFDHDHILTAGEQDGTLRLWNWDPVIMKCKLSKIDFREPNKAAITSVELYGKLLVTGSKDKTVKVWENVPRPLEKTVEDIWSQQTPGTSYAVFLLLGMKVTLAVASQDMVTLYRANIDPAKRINIWEPVLPLNTNGSKITCIGFPPNSANPEDGATLAAGCEDGAIRLWRAGATEEARLSP